MMEAQFGITELLLKEEARQGRAVSGKGAHGHITPRPSLV
jgi:hypothetical protein